MAAALMAVNVCADEVTLWDEGALCDNWSGVGVLSDAGLELKDAGAIAGDILRIYADVSTAAENWQLNLQEGHWDKDENGDAIAYANFQGANGDFAEGYEDVELTEAILTRAYTKSWWGNTFILNGTGGVNVTKITLVRPISVSETPKTLAMDAEGFIAASEFEGLHDRSKVVFTYNYAAEPTAAHKGWGVGRVGSNDDSGDGPSVVVISDMPANAAGDASVSTTYSEIKKALEATPDGIKFYVWNMDDIATTRVKVEVFAATVDGEGGEEAAALIDYPTSEDGIAVSGSSTLDVTVKIHTNTDAVKAIQFKNGYTSEGVINKNWAALTVDGGFKAGDKIEIAGVFNNSDDTKQSAVTLFVGAEGEAPTDLWKSELFINGRTVADDPAVQTYTLEADYAALKLGRANGLSGATGTWVTYLKVVRETATGIQEIPVKVVYNDAIYNLAGQKVNETYKGIVIKNGKKYIQK